MRTLILGSDSPLGRALVEFLGYAGRHEWVSLSRSACRWKSERQAKKSIARARCDAVVDLRIEAAADGGDQIQEMDLKRCHWVAKACQRTTTAYLHVSNSRVFSGQLGRAYSELDKPDNEETIGQLLASAETLVAEGCEHHLILRLGPVYSHEGTNLITQMLGPMRDGGSLILDNNLRGCPVSAPDGARVLSAILDQLSTGVKPWGLYHYGSSDSATYYEFAEAVLAGATQFAEFGPAAVQLQEQTGAPVPLNRSLNCSLIRSTFAIKQLTWRGAIADTVKRYYEQQE